MPKLSKHRSGCLQSAIGCVTWPPMEELEKVSKELKRSATLSVEQQYELTSTPELMSLVAYVAEDGLSAINGRRDPSYCEDHMTQYRGIPGPGIGIWGAGQGEGREDFRDSI